MLCRSSSAGMSISPRHINCWIGIHLHAAPDWQATGIYRRLPRRQIARILAVTITDMADRAHAQTDQVGFGMRRVAHEVAMQAAIFLRQRKLVLGQGEMIHADIAVAGAGKFFYRQLQQAELVFRAG